MSMMTRRSLCLALAALGVAGPARAAGRAELLMFDDPGCPWCRKWKAEVGQQAYASSAEGRRAPLRIVSFRDSRPAGITLNGAVRASPTFVLVQDGREVGRIVGYGGAAFFWSELGRLVKRLKPGDRTA